MDDATVIDEQDDDVQAPEDDPDPVNPDNEAVPDEPAAAAPMPRTGPGSRRRT